MIERVGCTEYDLKVGEIKIVQSISGTQVEVSVVSASDYNAKEIDPPESKICRTRQAVNGASFVGFDISCGACGVCHQNVQVNASIAGFSPNSEPKAI